jgi:hypothetical protein
MNLFAYQISIGIVLPCKEKLQTVAPLGSGMVITKIVSPCPVWCVTIISAHGRLRQEDYEFKATLGYIDPKQTYQNHLSSPALRTVGGHVWLWPRSVS